MGTCCCSAACGTLPVTYYLERLGAPACIRVLPFPPAVQAHPGSIDERQDAVEGYPGEMARVLSTFDLDGNRKLYAFGKRRGVGAAASAVMLDALNGTFRPEAELNLRGAFFDGVSVYGARPRADTGSDR